ncbi:MAG TPA: PEGA domain-containing protein [bacterium]|nr:PEGA domain-containing protein [bacterium]
MASESDQSRAVLRMSAIVGLVVLLAIAAARYFRAPGPVEVEGGEDSGSPYVIRSVPTRATVFVNNTEVGQTPYPYGEFDPGILRIRLEHSTLAPVETLLIISEDERRPVFPTFVFTVPVDLLSVPPGAQPVVDGHPLRPFERASFAVRATDTIEVAFELGNESTRPVLFNPIAGLLNDADSARWQWRPADGPEPARLTGIFAQGMRIASNPPGADIYLDEDPFPIGQTNGKFAIPYGVHTITLRLAPFEDYVAIISSGDGPPEPLVADLQRVVWLTAVDRDNPFTDLNAHIAWVKQDDRYVVNPDDRLVTPGGVTLAGFPSEVKFSCEGYADTTLIIPAAAGEVVAHLRKLPRREEQVAHARDEEMAWVRFVVKQSRRVGVAGAEIFGMDKDTGRIVRFGPTDADGILTTRVPIGDYDWWATREGYVAGKPNGERIKPSRKTKEITLKVKPL